jgi:chorismate mutase
LSILDTVMVGKGSAPQAAKVEMSARRLAIAEQIALAKWDSGTH